MSILDVLPSLRHAATPRFDPALWPSNTECVHGRIEVGGRPVDEIVDAAGTSVVRDENAPAVTVTRVLAVNGSTIVVDGGRARGSVAAAAVGNRHPLGPTAMFDIVSAAAIPGAVTLPVDVRAGDVLALVCEDGGDVFDLPDVHPRATRDVLLRTA